MEQTNPPATHLTLFRAPHISRDGVTVAMPVRKTLALFCYLAIEGRTSRERLASMFWSGLDEPTARRNLRHALHRLRGAGLGHVLLAEDETIGLAGVSHDLALFEQAVAGGRLREACAVRTGPLLEGLVLDGAPAFDDWLRIRRELSNQAWHSAALQYAAQCEAEGELPAAMAVHRRLVEEDPLLEAAYRDLMRLHDARGERAAALDCFARCERVLREELGLEPLPATRMLAERIRAREGSSVPRARGGTAASGLAVRGDALDLRRLPLVGRERERAAFEALDAAVVLVEGDAGVGKTRFAFEMAHGSRSASEEASQPLVIRCAEMSASTPFYAVVDALRSATARERVAALAAAWRRDLARLMPELHPPAQPPADVAAEVPASEQRVRLLEALAHALTVAAGVSRTVLFDDLQWADASSLELLGHLARRRRQNAAELPRIVATARSAELAGNAYAGLTLGTLANEGSLSRLRLEAFDEWSMLQLVQRLSGSQGGVAFSARLFATTGGNAFFAIETLRALYESGELRFDPADGWSTPYDDTTADYSELPLPASVVDAVQARVARLGAAAQRVLETAALAEDGSSLAELQGATALTPWEALEGLERAVAAHVIVPSATGYRFVHDLFRSAIRSGLSAERSRLTHSKLAAALEPLQVAPARIASHWQQAGRTELAVQAWVRAAEAAAAMNSHHEAIEHYRRAGELVNDDAQAFDLLDRRLERMRLAELADERTDLLAELMALAERSGKATLQFRALTRAAIAASDQRQMAQSESYALRALNKFAAPDDDCRVEALSVAAFAAGFLDRPEDSLRRYLEALSLARPAASRSKATMGACAALIAVSLDDLAQAVTLRDGALIASAAAPSSIHRGHTLSQVSCVNRALGDRAGALKQLEEAVAIAGTNRMSLYLAVFQANLCETLVDDGQLERARAAQSACADAFTNPAQPFACYLTALTAAAVHELQGDLGAALDAAQTAIDAADAMDSLPDQREARHLRARMLMEIGATDAALALTVATGRLVAPSQRRILLPAENLRAEAEMATEPARAAQRLQRALSMPCADRLLHPHLERSHILLGQVALALGDAQAARDASAVARYSVTLEAQALVIRLRAAALDGEDDPAAVTSALRLLESDRLSPLHALPLMRTVAARTPSRRGRAPFPRRRLQETAQSLADSLRSAPALQAAFIRKHRDLLT